MTALTVVKASDETRTTATATADSALSLTLAPNTTYRIFAQVVYAASATCDFRVGLSGGSDITEAALITVGEEPELQTNAAFNGNSRSAIFVLSDVQTGLAKPFEGTGNSTNYTDYTAALPITGIVTTGASGATLSVVWAQWTLSATEPARVLAGSCIVAEPLPANAKRQIIIKQTDESRDDPNADYAADAELAGLQLDANSVYHIEFCAPGYSKSSFATDIYGRLKTDADIVDRHLRYLRHTTRSLTTVSVQPARSHIQGNVTDSLLASWWLFNDQGNNTSYRGMMHCRGTFETGATAGELWFEWRKTNNGGEYGPDVTIFADAFIVLEKISECTFDPT